MNMNVFQFLTKEHEKVAVIFDKLSTTTERAVKTREKLFTQLDKELTIHAYIEEAFFYPVLVEEAKSRQITLEGYEEHHLIKLLLHELKQLPVDDEHWTAKLQVLKENVEHHVQEEERDMFKSARQVLTKEQIQQLGIQLQTEKQALLQNEHQLAEVS